MSPGTSGSRFDQHLQPRAGLPPSMTMQGDFVGIMHVAGLLENVGTETQEAPETGVSGALVLVVAGAGFEPAAFRL